MEANERGKFISRLTEPTARTQLSQSRTQYGLRFAPYCCSWTRLRRQRKDKSDQGASARIIYGCCTFA